MVALPEPPVRVTSMVQSPSSRFRSARVLPSLVLLSFASLSVSSALESASLFSLSSFFASVSSDFTGFLTLTLWSYHFPFVPIKATSNSSSIAGTGISNPYTSSLIPSLYVTVSVVGSSTSAPSFCASSAFPTKRFTIFLEARLTWIVILPSFTVRVPFPSFASFTWNIPLSVSNSAVQVPSSNVSLLDASVSLLSVFSESASFAVVSSLSVVSSVAVSVSVFAATGLVPIRVAEIVSADINNVNERFFMIISSPLSSYFLQFFLSCCSTHLLQSNRLLNR